MQGYSDRINHALAFAAKHHDQQVRAGMRPPYATQSANVGLILTRFGRDESSVIAGILLDVVEDVLRGGDVRGMLSGRIAEKFGADVLAMTRSIAERRTDDYGTVLSPDDRRKDVIRRIADADTRARWVLAAVMLHKAGTLLADLRRTVDHGAVWSRHPAGGESPVAWYRKVQRALVAQEFDAPIVDELSRTVTELEVLRGTGYVVHGEDGTAERQRPEPHTARGQ